MQAKGKHRRRKHRLPNHFGSIKYLGEGRRNPYGVYPPKSSSALCYVPDWETGYQVLVLFHAGVYKKGMEITLLERGREALCPEETDPRDKMVRYARKVMDEIEEIRAGGAVPWREGTTRPAGYTFAQVYDSFYEHKFGRHAKRKLSRDSENAYRSAWAKLEPVHARTLDEVDVDMLEGLVLEVADQGYSKAAVSRIVTLIHQLYRYGSARGYCSSTSGMNVEMPAARAVTHHQDFSDEDLARIWDAYRTGAGMIQDTARMVLIMCYSGFRVGEFAGMETMLDEEVPYFRGGFKTDAGRNRVVPIHSAILPLIREIKVDGRCVFLCGKGKTQFRRDMKNMLVEIGVDDPDGGRGRPRAGVARDGIIRSDLSGSEPPRYHTPHSTRHTFARLCESYGVNEADRKRMLGHSLAGDVTNATYGHRSIRELSEQIEKIQVPEV